MLVQFSVYPSQALPPPHYYRSIRLQVTSLSNRTFSCSRRPAAVLPHLRRAAHQQVWLR
jgi:hypothetical protein